MKKHRQNGIVFEMPNDFRTTQRDDVSVADGVGIDSSSITRPVLAKE